MSREPPNFERTPWPDEEPAQHRGRRFKPLIIFGIAAFAMVALYGVLAVVTWTDQIFFNEFKPGFLANLPGIDSGENQDRVNILVMGLDRRMDQSPDVPARTDTIFILTIDPATKTAGVLNIPRDVLVDIPNGRGGYFKDRINTAYIYGETQAVYPDGGPGLAVAAVERNFSISIDHYVVLDFNAFIALIDEIGGIDIDVPRYVFDPAYPECEVGCAPYYVEFLPGPEHMDGARALAYARIRHSDNDLKRIERQQLVMRAAAEKAQGLNLFLPNTVASLYSKFKDAVDTDLSDLQVLGLAKLAKDIGTERLRTVSLADAVSSTILPSGAAVLVADWDKVEALKRQIFLDGRLQAEAARIEVLNGSVYQGLATTFAEYLALQGLPSDSIQVADASDGQARSVTTIYDLNGKDYTVKKLAEWLRLDNDHIVDGDDPEAAPFRGSDADIVIVLGTDAGLPEG